MNNFNHIKSMTQEEFAFWLCNVWPQEQKKRAAGIDGVNQYLNEDYEAAQDMDEFNKRCIEILKGVIDG